MFCTYLRSVFIDYIKGVPFTGVTGPPVIALWNGDPGVDASEGAEIAGEGYERYPTLSTDWQGSSSAGIVSNSVDFAFPIATEYWGTATHVVLFGVGDTWPFLYGTLTSSKEIDEGSIARFKVGALQIILV